MNKSLCVFLLLAMSSLVRADDALASRVIVIKGKSNAVAIPYGHGVSLLRAIDGAGGFTGFGHSSIFIVRSAQLTNLDFYYKSMLKDPKKDILLEPWDIVVLGAPDAQIIAFKNRSAPVAIPYGKGVRLSQVIFSGPGFTEFGHTSMFIVRSAQPKKVDVTWKAMLKDPKKDILLEPWDIVVLARESWNAK